mgnify:CR=1 FL=1|jgi:hypothetical protein
MRPPDVVRTPSLPSLHDGERVYASTSRPGCQPHQTVPTVPPALPEELKWELQRHADELKNIFASSLQHRHAAIQAGKLFAQFLLPSRRAVGRPRSPEITKAIELVEQGLPIAEIAWLVIPNFEKLRPSEQSYRREQLRRAMHMRRQRKAVNKLQ